MSESEYPLEPFLWDDTSELSPQALLEKLHRPADTPVEERPLNAFFEPAIRQEDWYNDDEKAIAQRFQSLLDTLKQVLQDPLVYRVGRVEIDVYITGKTPAGHIVGLKTKVIET
jgi:hypothetical protein